MRFILSALLALSGVVFAAGVPGYTPPPSSTDIANLTGAGTGVLTALAVNVGTAGAFVVNGGAGGTPSSITLTNATGMPIAGLTGAGTSVLTALAVNVGSAGAFVTFNGAGGTPSSITLTNASGFPYATGGTGIVPVANGGSGVANTGNFTWTRAQTFGALTTANALGDVVLGPTATTQIAQIWQFLSGQTANLCAWENNLGAVKFAIGPSANRLSYGGQFVGTAPATPTFSSAARSASTTCVITVTDNPHKIPVGGIVKITAASVAAYNGTWVVTATTNTTFSYVCLSSATDTATSIVITPIGTTQLGAAPPTSSAAAVGTAVAISDNVITCTANANIGLAIFSTIGGAQTGNPFQVFTSTGTNLFSVSSGGNLATPGGCTISSTSASALSLNGSGGSAIIGNLGAWAIATTSTGNSTGSTFSLVGANALVWGLGTAVGGTTGWLFDARAVSGVTDQTAIDTTTLTAVTIVTRPIPTASGSTYNFELRLPITQGTVLADGLKFDMAAGNATFSFFDADVWIDDGAAFVAVTNSRMTAANTAVSVALTTSTSVVLYCRGTFTSSSAAATTIQPNLAKIADAGTGVTPLAGRYLHIYPSN